jgi:hypothetical protein
MCHVNLSILNATCNDAFRSVHSSNVPFAGAEGSPIGGSKSATGSLPVDRSHLHRSQADRCSVNYLAVNGPALQEMLSGAGQLAPRLGARAREADELRGLPNESVSEIDHLGMLGAATPVTLGGREEGPEAIFEVAFALSTRCGPTTWCGRNRAIHNLLSSAFRKEAQERYVGKGVCHECRPDPVRLEPRRLGPTAAHSSPARSTQDDLRGPWTVDARIRPSTN